MILVPAAMVAAALWLDLDMLLGAFTAGIVSRLLLSDIRRAEDEVIEAKLEAIGFGFLVPVFFVVSGMNLVFPLTAQRVRGAVRPPVAEGGEKPRVRAESW
nr:cation:proton antiporter [Streptomyces novaecaesareae]